MSERRSRQPGVQLRDLRESLDARREELEQTALTRITAISDPAGVDDPSYVVGLRDALRAALDYGLGMVEEEGQGKELPPVPIALIAQARMAARSGVSLETVLRRYAAGHSLLAEGLLEEATVLRLGAAQLKSVLRGLARRYDRIVAAVSEEYERESAIEPGGSERRRQGLLRRLLAGESVDPTLLSYELDAHHLAIVSFGQGVGEALAELVERIDRRLLLSEADSHTTWAWLGGCRCFDPDELGLISGFPWPLGSVLACGEPAEGLGGWRLSHRQAAAALPVAQRADHAFVAYSEVSLLAAALQDNLLAASLHQAYLDPLAAERQAGATAKETLRAYFEAARNISSAAALLGVNRRTVASRLAAVEERLGSSLDTIATELDVALRLDEFEQSAAQSPAKA